MNSIRKWMLLGVLLMTVGACSDDVEPQTNNSEPSDMSDMAVDQTPEPDANNPDEDMGNPPDMVVEPDEGLFDFGEFDFGDEELAVQDILPPSGSVLGGTPFVITGTGFTRDTAVFFGSRQAEAELVNRDLVGQTPPGSAPGPITVKVLDPEGGEVVVDGGFTYTVAMTVDAVSPARVPTSGGIEVEVLGQGFDEDTRVSFGGLTGLSHVLVSETRLRVITPPAPAGVVDVRASSRNATAKLVAGLTYYAPVKVERVRPASGTTAGGDTVTLEGSGFEDSMIVEFNGAAATVVSAAADGTSADVTTPAGAAGLADIRAETDSGADILRDGFFYAAPGEFQIAGVDPAEAPAIGGTKVTIIGSGLDDAALSIEFDSIPATIVESGPGHVVVEVPAHAPGVVDITATSSAGTRTLTDGFSYVENLWIDSVAPNEGEAAGGYDVVITGEGFTGATRVYFGLVQASFVVDSPTQITASAPAHTPGTVDVKVERGSVKASFRDAFTFTEPLEIFGYFPIRGSVAGNTYVEVLGRGFTDGITARFDQNPALAVQVLDSQTLTLRTPPNPTGTVPLVFERGADSATAPTPFTFFNPGARFGGAWGGPIQGAVNVTVYEMGGAPIESAFVMLSTNAQTPYTGYTDANGMVTISGPDVFGEQTITAVAEGYSSASLQRVNAENVTLFLSPPPPPPEGMPPAGPSHTFVGNVTGLDKLAEPGPTQFQMAIVVTTQVDPFTENPDPGGGNVLYDDGPYTLRSRVGDMAVVAYGGLFDNNTQEFTPLYMGIERYQTAADQQTTTVDIDLNIPLDHVLRFKLNQPPRGPNGPTTNEVTPWLDLGFEGVVGGYNVARGDADIIEARHQAELTGVLANASYFVSGGAVTPAIGYPSSLAVKRNVTNINQIIELPPLLGVPTITSPQDFSVPVDRTFIFNTNSTNLPSFYYVRITDFQQTPIWDVFLPGTETSFKLPDFPQFTGPTQPSPYPLGTFVVQIIGIRMANFNYANVSYADLDIGLWDAYSVNVHFVSF